MRRLILPVLVCCVLLLLTFDEVSCRRSGGSRSGRRGGSSSRRPSQPNYPRQPQAPVQPKPNPPVKSYPQAPPSRKPTKTKLPKTKLAKKGGFKTLGKIALATYIAKKMTPNIFPKYHKTYGRRHRPDYCSDCISINGSDLACDYGESFTRFQGRCQPSFFKPVCSTEFGLTSDEKPYVRRSCNERTCSSCSPHLADFTGNSSKVCYVIQCSVCNWDGCNDVHIQRTFPEQQPVVYDDDDSSGDRDPDGGALAVQTNCLAITAIAFLAYYYYV